jgi:hypothetical protein
MDFSTTEPTYELFASIIFMYQIVAMMKNGTKNHSGELRYTHSIRTNHIAILDPARNPGISVSPKVAM